MTYLGIDFSLNSPSCCVLNQNKFFWVSVTRSDKNLKSLLKSADKPYAVLSKFENFELDVLEKKAMPEDYSEKERVKIDYFLELVDFFWEKIKNHVESGKTKIAMEGLSFASNGNALIDISMATALLREIIVKNVGSDNFHVFSPTAVKKFAFKGNAKKDELYLSLCGHELPETNLNEFTKTLRMYQSQWITPAKSVNKPVDDLVDATWICLKLFQDMKSVKSNDEI